MSDPERRRLIRYVPNWDEEGTGRTEIIEVTPEEYRSMVGTRDPEGNLYLEPDADTNRAALQERADRELARSLEARGGAGTVGRALLDSATFGLSEWAINNAADDEQQERDIWEAQRARDPLANFGWRHRRCPAALGWSCPPRSRCWKTRNQCSLHGSL